MKNMNVNMHEIFSLLSECEREKFLIETICDLDVKQQATIIFECFGENICQYIDTAAIQENIINN